MTNGSLKSYSFSSITSGGGFSDSALNTLPSWQESHVLAYPDLTGTVGRGYPDISAMGNAYPIVVGGKIVLVSGTSVSAPVVAGMVSVSSERGSTASLCEWHYISRCPIPSSLLFIPHPPPILPHLPPPFSLLPCSWLILRELLPACRWWAG